MAGCRESEFCMECKFHTFAEDLTRGDEASFCTKTEKFCNTTTNCPNFEPGCFEEHWKPEFEYAIKYGESVAWGCEGTDTNRLAKVAEKYGCEVANSWRFMDDDGDWRTAIKIVLKKKV